MSYVGLWGAGRTKHVLDWNLNFPFYGNLHKFLHTGAKQVLLFARSARLCIPMPTSPATATHPLPRLAVVAAGAVVAEAGASSNSSKTPP